MSNLSFSLLSRFRLLFFGASPCASISLCLPLSFPSFLDKGCFVKVGIKVTESLQLRFEPVVGCSPHGQPIGPLDSSGLSSAPLGRYLGFPQWSPLRCCLVAVGEPADTTLDVSNIARCSNKEEWIIYKRGKLNHSNVEYHLRTQESKE